MNCRGFIFLVDLSHYQNATIPRLMEKCVRIPVLLRGGIAMLRRLIGFFDSTSVNLMLGSLIREVTAQYEKSGFDSTRAQQLASQEIKMSLSAHGVDLKSYRQVKAWRTGYMVKRKEILSKE